MKLLHRDMNRVVKSSQVSTGGEPVAIDNTVHMLPAAENDDNETELDYTERRRRESYTFDQQQRAFERQKAEFNSSRAAAERELTLKKEAAEAAAKAAEAEIIDAAKAKAGEIIRKAEAEGVTIKSNAKTEGHTEGFTEGRTEANEKCDKYIKASARFLTEVNSKKDAYYASHESELLETVLTMVKKITLAEISTDKDTIFRIVKEAAKGFRNSDYIKITLAEANVSEEIITDKQFLKSIVGEIDDIEMEILEDAESGTVMLDNGKEIIDASVPTQLEFLKEIMNGG